MSDFNAPYEQPRDNTPSVQQPQEDLHNRYQPEGNPAMELLENAPECVVRPEQIASMGNIVLGQGGENPQGKILLTRNLSDIQEVRDRCYYLPRNLLGKALKESLSVEIAGRTAVHPLQRLSAMLCGWLNHQEAWETVTQIYAEEEIIETLAADQLM